MIRCRVCDREHEVDTQTCACGADLRVDGIATGSDPRFGDADLGGELPDIGDLPDLGGVDFGGDALTDELTIPDEATIPDVASDPSPASSPEPAAEPSPLIDTRPSAPPPTRSFAVQPSADSGDGRAAEPQPKVPAPPGEARRAEVPTAPVVDPALSESVFADDPDGEETSGFRADRLRAGLGRATACPNCGEDVPSDRRFCRCGHQVVATPAREEEERFPEPSKATSLWRRLTGTGVGPHGDDRSWGQRAKDSGARRGMRYATRMSARTRFGRIGMLLASGAGLVMVVGPLRQQVTDLPDLFRAPDPAEVGWNAAGTCDAAADEDERNPWQTRWPGAPQPSDESTCPGVFDTITGTFPSAVDIDRMTVTIGNTSGQNVSINFGQPVMSPSVVSVAFTHDGDREPTVIPALDLQDTAAQQEFEADVRDATGFEITIVEVVGPDEHPWPELEVVQIAQVAFFRD